MLSEKTIEKLRKISWDKWENYRHQLFLYANSRCSKWMWRTGNKENLPEGYDPESISQEAINRLLKGTWEWDHEKYPEDSPVRFLKSEIRGFVSNLGHSDSHKRHASLEQETIRINGGDERQVKEVYASETGLGFSALKINTPYEEIYFKEIYEKIITLISDREDLVEFHQYKHLDGLTMKEIAKIMGKSEEQLKSLRRLYVRRIQTVQKEFFEELNSLRGTSKGGLHVIAKKGNG